MSRDLQDIMSSGEITGINIGGTATGNEVVERSYVDATINGKADVSYVDAEIAKVPSRAELNEKASRGYVDNAIINTFSGTALPDPSLGKTGDRYHRYATDTAHEIKNDSALEAYSSTYFELFYDAQATSGPTAIGVEPSLRAIYVDYNNGQMPPYHEFVITLNNNTHILSIASANQGGVTLNYPQSADPDVFAISVGDPFLLSGKLLSGVDEDYTKFDNVWYFTPIMDRTYDFEGQTGITISSDTFMPVAHLNITDQRVAGTYELKFSYTFTYSVTTRSAIFRWSMDGGVTWEEYFKEVKDTTNKEAVMYSFPWNYAGGTPDIRLEARCESVGDTLEVLFANIVMERKA